MAESVAEWLRGYMWGVTRETTKQPLMLSPGHQLLSQHITHVGMYTV